MGVYANDCLLRPVQDKSPWWRKIIWPPILFQVAQDFEYHCEHGRVIVREGFLTDGATVPRPFRWLFPSVGNYLRAAIVHDAALQHYDRNRANAIFLEALIDDGINDTVCALLYAAVSWYAKLTSLVAKLRRLV